MKMRHDPADRSEAARRGPILMIAPQPFYQDRGTPIALRTVLEALSSLGYEVDVLTYPMGAPVEIPGVRLFRVRGIPGVSAVPIGLSLSKLLLDARLVPSIAKRLRERSYQCIHAVEEAAFPAACYGRMRRIPVIYDMQSCLPEQLAEHSIFRQASVQRALRLFETWLVRNVDAVVCSAGLEDYVRSIESQVDVTEWYFPSEPLDISATDAESLRGRLDIRPGSRIVLYAGTFERYQGVSRLLAAAPKVVARVPNAVFVLVGMTRSTTPPRSEAIEELERRGALRLLERRPRSEMASFLALADVVVAPREKGMNVPLKLFDYMAAGKPIVTTDFPSQRRVLGSRHAVFVDPSRSELADAIGQLLLEPERAARLGEAAQRYAEKHLTRKAFAKRLEMVYERARETSRRVREEPSTGSTPRER